MKLGIVGAGQIVNTFFEFANQIDNMELVAICATPQEKEKIEKMAGENNIAKCYTDYDELLEDEVVDTIYIAVPNHLHFSFCKKAILARNNVICEKPFTSNFHEATELAELARKNNVIVLEAVSTRFIPNVLKIKELLPSLGEIKIVAANYSQYSSRYDDFKKGEILPAFNPKMSGGALMDLNIYNVNLMVTLFGTPKSVNYSANIQRGIDTSGVLDLDYESFKSVCIAAKDCKAPLSTTIQGDKGSILITSSINSVSNFQVIMNANNQGNKINKINADELDYNNNKHRMYHEFIQFVKIIDNNNWAEFDRLMEISLTTMDIQTKARQSAGIVFPTDNIQ